MDFKISIEHEQLIYGFFDILITFNINIDEPGDRIKLCHDFKKIKKSYSFEKHVLKSQNVKRRFFRKTKKNADKNP